MITFISVIQSVLDSKLWNICIRYL